MDSPLLLFHLLQPEKLRSVQLNQRFIARAWFTGEAKEILNLRIRFTLNKGGISKDNGHINDRKFSVFYN